MPFVEESAEQTPTPTDATPAPEAAPQETAPEEPTPPPEPKWFTDFQAAGPAPFIPQAPPQQQPAYIAPPPAWQQQPAPQPPPDPTLEQIAENPHLLWEKAREIARAEAEQRERQIYQKLEEQRQSHIRSLADQAQADLRDTVAQAKEFFQKNVASDPAYANPKFREVADAHMQMLIMNAVEMARVDIANGRRSNIGAVLNERNVRIGKALAFEESGVPYQQRIVTVGQGVQGVTTSGQANTNRREYTPAQRELMQRLHMTEKEFEENEKAADGVVFYTGGGQ